MKPEGEETHHRPDDHLVEPFFAGLGHEERQEPQEPGSPAPRPSRGPTLWSRVWNAITSLGRSAR